MKLGIFGASGMAREVLDISLELAYKDIIFIDRVGKGFVEEFSIVSEDQIDDLRQAGYKFVIGIGDPKTRLEIKNRYPELDYVNLIHPTVTFGYKQLDEVRKRAGNIFCAGARITSNIIIGNFGIYGVNCTVSHDCIIEDFVTIGPGANISGNILLSSGAYIGTNACILQGKSNAEKLIIGRNAVIGAGAVVTKNIPEHKIVKGNPAK